MVYRLFKVHTVHLLAHKVAGSWFCACVPDICNLIHWCCIPLKYATQVSMGSRGHVQCIQAIGQLKGNCLLHAAHVRLTYACISLQSYPSMAALRQMTHRGILRGLQVTYSVWNSFPNMQTIVYHTLSMRAQYMHVFHFNLIPPWPRCTKRCIAGF